MWVAGQAFGANAWGTEFLAVMRQVLFIQATFQISPGINARRAVRLEEHQIAAVRWVAAVEKMVETHFKQISGAGVAGDVPAQLAIGRIGPRHHGQGVPAHERCQLFFDGQVAGVGLLGLHGNGVGIGRDQLGRPINLTVVRHDHQLVE